MITCPNCKNTLPDWATACQFCHTDVRSIPRSKQPDDVQRYGHRLSTGTLNAIYYALATLWIVTGAFAAWEAVQPVKFMGETIQPGAFEYVIAGFGGIRALIGIGLAVKLEVARGIVNFVSALSLLFGLLGLVGSLMGTFLFGPLAILGVVENIVSIIVAGGTIWIIGETSNRTMGT